MLTTDIAENGYFKSAWFVVCFHWIFDLEVRNQWNGTSQHGVCHQNNWCQLEITCDNRYTPAHHGPCDRQFFASAAGDNLEACCCYSTDCKPVMRIPIVLTEIHILAFFIIILVVICINFSQNISSCLICNIPHTVQKFVHQVTVVVKVRQCAEKTGILSASTCRYALCNSSRLVWSVDYLAISQKCTGQVRKAGAQPHFV